jgi:hypothetical protein
MTLAFIKYIALALFAFGACWSPVLADAENKLLRVRPTKNRTAFWYARVPKRYSCCIANLLPDDVFIFFCPTTPQARELAVSIA